MSFKRCTKTHDDQLLLLPRDKDQDNLGGNCAIVFGGGWWHNACMYAHPTGLSSTTKTYSGKYVFYYFGGERVVNGQANGRSYESFAEAEFLLVPK